MADTTHHSESSPESPPPNRARLVLQLIGLFLKIGAINFGGPMALIAIMEREFVQRRKWVSKEHFLDMVAATNMVPGPNACELAGLIGYERAGHLGLIAAEFSFFLPAVLLSSLLGVVYVRYGSLPQVDGLFYGINPVILALILFAIYRLGKNTLRSTTQLAIFALALLTVILNLNQVLIIFGAGFLAMLIATYPWKLKSGSVLLFLPLLSNNLSLKPAADLAENILLRLFLFFFKTGALIFGSGMVLFAYIQEDIVERFGWLTQKQLIDAIAVGQMTPGPVTSSSAFIGYLIAGWPGAGLAALGNFLPSFFIVMLIGPIIPRMRAYKPLQAFLRGINAAVIALMLSISWTVAQNAVSDPWTLLLTVASLLVLLLLKWDSLWLVLGGALIGLLHSLLS